MTSDDERIDDLKDTINTRFDETNRRIQNVQDSLKELETKDHASSEIKHLHYRINDLESRFQAYKKNLWLTVSAIATVVAFIVTTALAILNLVPSLA